MIQNPPPTVSDSSRASSASQASRSNANGGDNSNELNASASAISPALAPPPELDPIFAHWADRADDLKARLASYIETLLKANAEFNLTGDAKPELQWRRHIEDSLICASLIEQVAGRPGPETRIVDIGSGGGMPGIVWAILWPEASVTLVESREKKAEFLEMAVGELGCENVSVHNNRSESLPHNADHRERYDWVSARGVSTLATVVEYGLPFVRIGGWLFSPKGEQPGEEIKSAKRAIRLLGSQNPARVFPYARTDGKACNLVAVRKIERTPAPYPRRVGVAAKCPL